MRKILLIEKDGEKFYVIAKLKKKRKPSVSGLEVRSTGEKIPIEEVDYLISQLNKGIEEDEIGFASTTDEGEVEFYRITGTKNMTHECGRGWYNIILYVEREKINILENIYEIKDWFFYKLIVALMQKHINLFVYMLFAFLKIILNTYLPKKG